MPVNMFLRFFPGILIKPVYSLQNLKSDASKVLIFFCAMGLPFLLSGAIGRAFSDQRFEQFADRPFILLLMVHLFAKLVTMSGGSWMIARLAGSYNLKPGFGQVFKLSLTAFVPFFLSQFFAGVVLMFFWLPWAGLAYTVFIFYSGSGIVLEIPRNRLTGFTLLSFFVFLGLGFIGLYLCRMIIFAPVIQH